MKYLYKYPQRAYPVRGPRRGERAARRGTIPSTSCSTPASSTTTATSTSFVEYAKAAPDDILIRISVANRGPDAAPLHLLPTLWFKNDWSWTPDDARGRASRSRATATAGTVLAAAHRALAPYWLLLRGAAGRAVHRERDQPRAALRRAERVALREGRLPRIRRRRPPRRGESRARPAPRPRRTTPSRSAPARRRSCGCGSPTRRARAPLGAGIRRAVRARAAARPTRSTSAITPFEMPDDMRNVQRQAFAGMLWNKQYYRYMVERWLEGDPAARRRRPSSAGAAATTTGGTSPPATCMSMPDKWEYPWFAAWDMAFHAIAVRDDRSRLRQGAAAAAAARVVHAPERPDPGLRVGVRRRQSAGARLGGDARLPDRGEDATAARDREFLERVFQKLLINFTWWVNRKDAEGNNIFEGGFLGLDNIGVFDRTLGLPDGRLARAGRRHELDGDVLPEHARDRARAGARRTRCTRTSRPSSSSTSSTSAPR